MKKNNKFLILFLIIVIFVIILIINKKYLFEIFANISNSFQRTLIDEDRYILILQGLKSTLIISFTSILFGTLIGIALFMLRISKFKVLSTISKIIINVLRGMPITVLLLIYYYVIFGKININPIIVAIITFSLYFSAYTSEIFRGAYLSLNKSQIISSYALGFNKIQTIHYIVLPQILTYIIPVFKNESVSLVKLTSIAGYISIMDLTKASDIIRNRTYEAFFPLIFTALLYYLICYLYIKILNILYKKINPRKEKNMNKKSILKMRNVSKYYKNELIFKNVNFELKKGDVISIVGKSGCGKSTMLKCINKLEEINSGEIMFNGVNINEIPLTVLRQKIGIVFQEYNLFDHLTVIENLTLALIKIKKYSLNRSLKLARDVLKKIDLLDKQDKYPDELSGGQKQRVAIARTLLMKPEIILLDEPTSALDKEMKESVLNLIKEMVKEDMTLIIVSHEENFVENVSDKIFKLDKNGLKEL